MTDQYRGISLNLYSDAQHCHARVRLFFVLWKVRCNGELEQRPSHIHVGRVYSVCKKCGDVGWLWPTKPEEPGAH